MCDLSPEEKAFIIQCIDGSFEAGLWRGKLGAMGQTVGMAHNIVRKLQAAAIQDAPPLNGHTPEPAATEPEVRR